MTDLTLPCPICNSAMRLKSAGTNNTAGMDASFQCSSRECGQVMTGHLAFASSLPAGTLAFNSRALNSTQSKDDSKGWIAVDLDGTLANQKPGSSFIGKPIAEMVKRINEWRDQGYEVRIFTVRAADALGVRAVKAWLRNNNLPDLAVTNVKAPGMVELWDNRAVRVATNSGTPCAGCKPSSNLRSSQLQPGESVSRFKTDC